MVVMCNHHNWTLGTFVNPVVVNPEMFHISGLPWAVSHKVSRCPLDFVNPSGPALFFPKQVIIGKLSKIQVQY